MGTPNRFLKPVRCIKKTTLPCFSNAGRFYRNNYFANKLKKPPKFLGFGSFVINVNNFLFVILFLIFLQ
ncbi:MAG: hypothetical protein DRJ01_15140 [Bacteroidetes bacterium]|nr:MAG: hypothetical protein DRJ01_15140 [Bacteroidota bacterium]